MSSVFICISIAVVIMLSLYLYKTYGYWSDCRVPHLKPLFPIVGNMYDIFLLRTPPEIIRRIYQTIKTPFAGIYVFFQPILIVKDPDLIKKILVTDFHNFVNRGFKVNSSTDPFYNNIIHAEEHDWNIIRPKITASFHLGRIKNMVGVMNEISEDVVKNLNIIFEEGKEIEIMNLAYRYTIDCLMKTTFGVNSNCLKEPNAEFFKIGKTVLGLQFVKHIFLGLYTPFLHTLFGVTMASDKVTRLFKNVVKDIFSARKSTSEINKDFVQTLLDMKEEYENEKKSNDNNALVIDDNFVTGQVFITFVAGFETPANTVTFCMYELSQSPVIQEKVFQEIKHILGKFDNKVSYESLQEMKYLQQVIQETLRKYPPLTLIFRKCSKEYTIPETDSFIESGTTVLIPVFAIHHDPKHFPNPQVFDPERFNEENVGNIHPGTYLPFGIGPRNCPGNLFSYVKMKIFLLKILLNFKISLGQKVQVPLGFNPKQFVLTPESSGVWFKMEKRRIE
uniref:Cytochrome P450 n=1 Tax=Clastoptera arizonana TaxID=38151 RepID=A0A1B6C6N2_9HEMI